MRRMAQRIAELFRPGVRKPDLRTVARTGDARYVPQINHWGRDRHGRVAVMASRLDSITIRDYDRVRFYPVVRDALAVLRVPVSRARFHFHCPERPEIAELAQAVLAPKVRPLLETLVRGAFEFGHQVVEKRWQPVWDVSVGDGDEAARYPFVWSIRKFASLSPQDTVLLVHPRSGEFAGVRQFAVGATISDVPRAKCVWYVNDQEFDGNYGVPRTKAAVPYVEIAESIWDDMAKHSKRFAVAWTVGRHRPGFSAGPDGARVDNAVTMAETMEGLESGHSVSLPAEYDAATGHPFWGIEVTTPPAEDRYVEKLKFVNDVIRMACVVPDKASSQTAETGTYNLGETQIELFLENAEAILDDLKTVIEEQLLGDFVDYNFGPDAPRLRIVFQPLDVKIKRMLLNALVGLLGQGPVALADGREIEADWEGLAGDAGVPLKVVDARDRARRLLQAARERLAALDDEEGQGPDGAGPSREGAKLAEDQPREPKGQPGGGRFAKKNGGAGDDADESGEGAFPPGFPPPWASTNGDGESRIEEHPEFDPDHVVDGVAPTGYGAVGPVFAQFTGDGHGAINHLLKAQVGEVPGALSHPDVGEVDLIWGNEKSGLCKIARKHPEVVENLPEIVSSLPLARTFESEWILEDSNYVAVVKRNWMQAQKKSWLLTAFSRKTGRGEDA